MQYDVKDSLEPTERAAKEDENSRTFNSGMANLLALMPSHYPQKF